MANTARNKPGEEQVTVVEESNALDNLQGKYESNKNRINTIITVVLIAVIGFFAYQKLYKAPQENKAANAIVGAQHYFEADSMNKALNGDGQQPGFLKIMKKYSGTPTANLCHYYAGICYLKTGDFKNAIKQLEDFNGKGTISEKAAYGALGDAYMESGNTKKGIEFYNKAAADKNDAILTPMYLSRAGMAYEKDGQADKAKESYKRVRDEFPQSMQARDMDKYLARLGVLD
ncbi:MAG: tetratricopeptide repeat protein [Sphingobacteriales bacterium]|nr:MAG: tetratricopeptide repeat protein [Sphingobacteriales bacterium]